MKPTARGSGRVVVRRAARVIVIDRAARILLLAVRDPADKRLAWWLPGGGIEPGESIEQTARRELLEETGLGPALDVLGPVWKLHHDFRWGGRDVSQDEWFFVVRLETPLDAATIRPAGRDGGDIEDATWATLTELAEWPAVIAPRRLAELLAPVLAGHIPAEPIDTGT